MLAIREIGGPDSSADEDASLLECYPMSNDKYRLFEGLWHHHLQGSLRNVGRWTTNTKTLRSFDSSVPICEPTRRKAVLWRLVCVTNTRHTYWPLVRFSLPVNVIKVKEITLTVYLWGRDLLPDKQTSDLYVCDNEYASTPSARHSRTQSQWPGKHSTRITEYDRLSN
jgi:hypothetical protein